MAATYYELVIKGDSKEMRGFLRGYEVGRSIKSRVCLCRDEPINTHHLRDILTFQGDHLHIICSERNRAGLLLAISQAEDLQFEIVSDKRIAKTYFEFEFETVSKKVASDIKRKLRTLPSGLRLTGYEPEETIDPSAAGVELYTPVPGYRFKGKGTVQGDFVRLLAYHKELVTNEFIRLEEIVIET
jgi:hypothetical protein